MVDRITNSGSIDNQLAVNQVSLSIKNQALSEIAHQVDRVSGVANENLATVRREHEEARAELDVLNRQMTTDRSNRAVKADAVAREALAVKAKA